MVHRVGQRREVVWTVRGIGDERLAEQHLERLGEARIDVARAPHAGADRRARHGLVEHGTYGEHARAGVAGARGLDELGRKRRAVARRRRGHRERRVNAHHPVGPARDRRGVDVELLAAVVPRLEIDADGDEHGDRVVEREPAVLRTARLENGSKGFRGRRAVRACCGRSYCRHGLKVTGGALPLPDRDAAAERFSEVVGGASTHEKAPAAALGRPRRESLARAGAGTRRDAHPARRGAAHELRPCRARARRRRCARR
jgi:hypothetical protein